ncbi:UDP-glucose--hexose-1-phosphate uridylyltransferase [Marinilactibacillus psychrotolerans]|uniref:UDP-glucose--hexose-1-phosphate uridylyltransferase n=1 Tax=Marinilactibacillus psychrotolerans TaxID=191770 RepID=UPI0038894577
MKKDGLKQSLDHSIDQIILMFIDWYVEKGKVDPLDRIYLVNQLLELLGKKGLEIEPSKKKINLSHLDLLDHLIKYAVDNKIVEDTSSEKDIFGAKIMNIVTPRPSEVNDQFWKLYAQDIIKATEYFYAFSKESNYIKTREIAKNIEYKHQTEYGEIEITINLSKPEKDPKNIAAAKIEKLNYPVNMLCMENEGYAGNKTHPGRSNHRIIRMDVSGELWGFQYSPYSYYNEHAIFLSKAHRAMNVGEQAIKNLLDILTTLPHYFVGSNAGLPIVGGSILSHDHYQGGRHTFPLEHADIEQAFQLENLPDVKAGIVKWPMSVIRLQSEDKKSLEQAAKKVMDTWKAYSDQSVDVLAYTNGTPHNAVTPIARRRKKLFELDLVLRNNRTSDTFPDGIFHPHPHVQHIKKENIGLIEVMGLAILPPRLERELDTVKEFLLGKDVQVAPVHRKWAEALKEKENLVTPETVKEIIYHEVGEIFLQVLKDAGVFKRNEQGKKAFIRFLDRLKKA